MYARRVLLPTHTCIVAALASMASKKKSVSFTLTKGDSSVECSVPVGVAPDSFLRAAEATLTKLAAARLASVSEDEEEDEEEDDEDDEGEGDDLEACAEEDDAETSPVPTKEDLKFLKTHPDDRLARKLERAVISPTEVSAEDEEETSEEEEEDVDVSPPPRREPPKRASKDEGEAVRAIQARLLSVDPEEIAKALSPPAKQMIKRPTSPPAVSKKRGPKQQDVPRFDADSVAQARRKKLREAALAKLRVVDITDSDLEEATSAHEVARRAGLEAAAAGAPVLPAKAGV